MLALAILGSAGASSGLLPQARQPAARPVVGLTKPRRYTLQQQVIISN